MRALTSAQQPPRIWTPSWLVPLLCLALIDCATAPAPPARPEPAAAQAAAPCDQPARCVERALALPRLEGGALDVAALELLEQACLRGERDACGLAGVGWLEHPWARDGVGAWSLLRRGCALGSALACGHLAYRAYSPTSLWPPGEDRALASLAASRGCDLGDGRACWVAAVLPGEAWDPHYGQRALASLEPACGRGDLEACHLASGLARELAPPREGALQEQVVALTQEACRQGDAHACWDLGRWYGHPAKARRRGLEAQQERARHYVEQACRSGRHRRCFELADWYAQEGRWKEPIDSPDPARAQELRQQGIAQLERRCQAGEPSRCFRVAEIHRSGQHGATPDPEQARRWRQEGERQVRAACAQPQDDACGAWLGELAWLGLPLAQEQCQRGQPWGCYHQAQALSQDAEAMRDPAERQRVQDLYREATEAWLGQCEVAPGLCRRRTAALERSFRSPGVHIEVPPALVLHRALCQREGGSLESCARALALEPVPQRRPAWEERVQRRRRDTCEQQEFEEKEACLRLLGEVAPR